MGAVDPLVAEDAPDLVDAIEPADHQALEVQLGGDAQLERDVERVVVRLEGARRRAARLLRRVEDGRLHLDELALVEEAAHPGDELRPAAEGLAHFGIGGEIDVALAVAGLDVAQTVPLLRQRPQRLGDELETAFARLDGQLPGTGPHGAALHPGDVAEVEQLQGLVGRFANFVLLHEGLQIAIAVAQGKEGRLAHGADGHHPASDGVRTGRLGFQGLGIVGGMHLADVAGRGGDVDAGRIGIEAALGLSAAPRQT